MILSTTFRRTVLAAAGVLLTAALPATAAEWRILSVNGAASTGDARLTFEAGGDFAGRTGCNNFRGSARFEGGALIVDGPVATTRMACPGAGLTAQEDAILRVMQAQISTTYDPLADLMTLSRGSDSFAMAPLDGDAPPPPARTPEAEKTPTIFDTAYLNVFGLSGPLNVRQEPTTRSQVVGKVLAGTLLRSEGCESRADRDWCQVRFVDSSGTVGWAAAEYLEPAPASLRAGQGVFDGIGTLSCAIGDGEAMTTCDYGLARDGSHSVAVVVFKPDGSERVLYFADGAFAYSDTSEAGGGFESSGELIDGRFAIRVDSERYEIDGERVFPE